MRTRPQNRTKGLRALGAGLMLWSGAASAGCGSTAPVVERTQTVPAAPRNLLNAEDSAPPAPRATGPVSPARPVLRTAMRRDLASTVFSQDSKRLFAVSTHGELVAYDVETGALRGYARPWFDGTYPTLQVDSSGSRVLVLAPDRGGYLWDLRSDTLESLPSTDNAAGSLQFALHPNGEVLAQAEATEQRLTLTTTRLDDGTAQRVELAGAEALDGAVGGTPFLRYSPSGARIVLLTDQGSVFTLLDASDLSVVRRERLAPLLPGDARELDEPGAGFQVALRPQGGQLALARPGRVELLDSLSGRVRADAALGGRQMPWPQYSADGRWLVVTAGSQVTVIEAQTGRVSARVALDDVEFSLEDATFALVPLPGAGGFIALDRNGAVVEYDATGQTRPVAAALLSLYGVLPRYAPSGEWALIPEGTPRLLHVGEDTPRWSFVEEGAQVSVWGADFGLDGRSLFVRSRAGVSRFATEGMRDLSCGSERPTTRGPGGAIAQLGGYTSCLFDTDQLVAGDTAVTHDGGTRITFEDNEFVVHRAGASRSVRLARAGTSKLTCEDPATCMRGAQLSPDGSTVGFQDATRDGPTRQVWWELYDTQTGRLRAHGTRDNGYYTLQMLAGGAFAIVGENLYILHDARGRVRLTLEDVHSQAVGADGALVAVQTRDQVVHIIDALTLRERERWSARGPLGMLGVTPDHQRVLASSDDSLLVTTLDGSIQHPVPLAGNPPAINPAGTYALACDGLRAVRIDLRTGAQVDVTRCEGRPDAISEDGAFAVMTVGSSTRVHRLADGRRLTLETLIGPPSLHVAYDDTGRWEVSEANSTGVLIRAAGAGDTAPLENPREGGGTPGLFGMFMAGQ